MSIHDLIESRAEVTIKVTPEELRELAVTSAEQTLSKAQSDKPYEDELLTPEEVCKMLKISRRTLDRHSGERGDLPSIEVFGSRRWRKSVVENYLNQQ